jgi:hypothetical protein
MEYTPHVEGTDHLNVKGHLGTPGEALLLRSKVCDGESFRSFKIRPKVAFILGCRLFVTRSLSTRAIGVAKVNVWEGSIAVWVGAKVIEVDAEEVFRVVRPPS